MYGSDPFNYDFESSFLAAHNRATARRAATKAAEDDTEARFYRGLMLHRLGGSVVSLPAPTAEQLHRHTRRFGSEGVREIAEVYGVNLRIKKADPKAPPRKRRTTPDLRAQVLDLHERGLMLGPIADALNVSDQRVRTILAEAGADAGTLAAA